MLSGPVFIRFVFFLALSLLFPNPADSVQLRDIGERESCGWGSGEFEKGMFCLSWHADPGCFDEKTALELACLAGIGIQYRGFLSYFLVFARFPAKCSLGELLVVRKREPRAQASIKSQPAVRSLPSVCRDCRKRRGKKRNFLSEFALALPFASG